MRKPTIPKPLLDSALLCACTLALFYKLFLPEYTLRNVGIFTDWALLSFPTYALTGQYLAEGVFPLWNPYIFSGFPHFAMPESALLYPATWLFALGSFDVVSRIDVLMHLCIFVLGIYWLGRDLFQSRRTALFFALVALTGLIPTQTIHDGAVWGYRTLLWIPVALFMLRRIIATRRPIWAAGLAATVALQIYAGYLQGVSYTLLALALYTTIDLGTRLLSRQDSFADVLNGGLKCLGAVALGMALTAPQLLATRELLDHSIRKFGVTQEYFYVVPQFPTTWTASYFLQDTHGYTAGVLVGALFLTGIIRSRSHERLICLAAFTGTTAYIFLPDWFYDVAVRHISVLANTRGNIRMTALARIFFYIIAGYGIAALLHESDRRRQLLNVYTYLACAIALGIASILYAGEWSLALFVAIAVIAVMTLAARTRRATVSWIGSALLALIVAERAVAALDTHKYGSPSRFRIHQNVIKAVDTTTGMDRSMLLIGGPHSVPGIGPLTQERFLNGYHALLLNNFAAFMEKTTDIAWVERDKHGRLRDHHSAVPDKRDWVTKRSLRALNMLNVAYIIGRNARIHLMDQEIQGYREQSEEYPRRRFARRRFGRIWLYQNLDAMPPAYVFHKAEVFNSDAEAIQRFNERAFDYREVALLTTPFDVDSLAPARSKEVVAVSDYGINEVEVTGSLSAPGIIVLSDVYYPGWRAIVNGEREEPVLEVNTFLRGVALPAGEHTIRFVYRPTWLIPAVVITLLALVIWMAIVIPAIRRGIARLRHPDERVVSVERDGVGEPDEGKD